MVRVQSPDIIYIKVPACFLRQIHVKKRERQLSPSLLLLLINYGLVSCLCSWVSIHVDPSQAVQTYVGVNLGGVDSGVTKQILNYTKVSSAFKQVSGECMSQSVGSDWLVDTSFEGILHDDAVDRS